MTRELKFKFYVHSEKRMIESIGFLFECQTQIRIWYRKNDVVYNESFATHDVSQLQYAGIKDTNGDEIYEGCILQIPEFYETPEMTATTYANWQVVFVHGCFHLSNKDKTTEDVDVDDYNLYQEYHNYDERFTIIGNIYENPEIKF